MALTIGRVTCLQLDKSSSSIAGITEDGTDILWGFFIPDGWKSLLQEALTNGNQVELAIDDESSEYLYVRVNKSPEP
jgi:hypothetical protein